MQRFLTIGATLLLSFTLCSTQPILAQDAPAVEQVIEVVETTEVAATAEQGLQESINNAFGEVNSVLGPILFVDVSGGAVPGGLPLIVLVLMLGGIFFTFRFGFINLRLFGHSIAVIRGKYDNPDDEGDISHFQALTSALSATVGLGNIAMVAVAISQGGAGAVFWLWIIAFFGMSSKFSSCSLAQVYRKMQDKGSADQHVLGGPMLYLEKGVPEQLGGSSAAVAFGKTLAILFAVFAIGGAIGGGNLFQANQTFEVFSNTFLDGDRSLDWLAGALMAILVGAVVIGGIKRIGEVTSKIVPAMCAFYCIVCLIIIIANIGELPGLIANIFAEAFSFEAAGWGGFAAVFVVGAKRAAFSNEAGLGSAAIAHSAAKTDEPVREGIVAMIGPFIDTILVCSMTAFAILITGAHIGAEGGSPEVGVSITAKAFGSVHESLPYMLCIAVFVFAYSTMISWCYYGERATEYLFGKKAITPYRFAFLFFTLIGPMVTLANVVDFSDLLILSMAYPNIIGMIILSPKLAKLAKDYTQRLKSGEIKPYK